MFQSASKSMVAGPWPGAALVGFLPYGMIMKQIGRGMGGLLLSDAGCAAR